MSQLFVVIDKNTGAEVTPSEVDKDSLAWKPIGRVGGFVVDQEGSLGIETRSGEVAFLSLAATERYKVIFNYSQIGEAR